MSTPFIGQLCFFGFEWVPRGFLRCDGSICSIQQYAALYSLLGTAFGGDGKKTFALPNMSGRTLVGTGLATGGTTQWQVNTQAGTESVTISNPNQVPSHAHSLQIAATTSTTGTAVSGALLGAVVPNQFFVTPPPKTGVMNPAALASAFAPFPSSHENRQPYLVVNPCICYDGMYPQFPD